MIHVKFLESQPFCVVNHYWAIIFSAFICLYIKQILVSIIICRNNYFGWSLGKVTIVWMIIWQKVIENQIVSDGIIFVVFIIRSYFGNIWIKIIQRDCSFNICLILEKTLITSNIYCIFDQGIC